MATASSCIGERVRCCASTPARWPREAPHGTRGDYIYSSRIRGGDRSGRASNLQRAEGPDARIVVVTRLK